MSTSIESASAAAASHRTGAGPRVAIVHEWLSSYAGSERVIEQMLEVYPEADLFAVVDFLEPHERGFLRGKPVTTTFIQNLPFARKRFRGYLPLMPLAMEQLDLSGYDIVLSSNHAVAKGVITGPDQLHVCYVHSPIRYAWDLQHQYLQEAGLTSGPKSWIVRLTLHYMRQWDARSANGVDAFIANSAFIAHRVKKVYRRDAQVIYPPVAVDNFPLRLSKESFYVTASRMVPYKKVPLVIQAFAAMPDKHLVVIGDGSEFPKARQLAAGAPNITFLGYQPNPVLVDYMQRARAFVFAAEEDFGITPVEAQSCGTPVIAYGRGGSLETVRGDGPPHERTGVFFPEQSVSSIVKAVQRFEAEFPADEEAETHSLAMACRNHAERFAPEVFRRRLEAAVSRAFEDFQRGNVVDFETGDSDRRVNDRMEEAEDAHRSARLPAGGRAA